MVSGDQKSLLVTLGRDIGVRQCGTDEAVAAAAAIHDGFCERGLEPAFQEFPLLRYDAEEPRLWVEGSEWLVGPCMYAHPGTCEGPVERLSDGVWGVDEGRLIRSPFGKGPIPFAARRTSAPHIATPPTAFLSRADDRRLTEGQHARLVVDGQWVAGGRDRNVIAQLRGKTAEKVVVGAHFDSVWRSPGIVDNATGIEGLFRLVDRFLGRRLPRTLEFVAFAAEEVGLVGSRRYIAHHRERGSLKTIVGMVNLDCIGYGEKLQLLCAGPALRDRALAFAAGRGLTTRYDVTASDAREIGTDHLPFAEEGIPATSILHFPYEEYHLPEESLELVSDELLDDAVNLAADMIEFHLESPLSEREAVGFEVPASDRDDGSSGRS